MGKRIVFDPSTGELVEIPDDTPQSPVAQPSGPKAESPVSPQGQRIVSRKIAGSTLRDTEEAFTLALLPGVERALNDKRPAIRRRALDMLSASGAWIAPALGHVARLLDDPDETVRAAAREAFRSLGFHPSCLGEIERLLAHKDVAIRLETIRLLALSGEKSARASQFLVGRLYDSQPEVRAAASSALYATGLDGAALSRLAVLFENGNADLKRSLLEILGAVGHKAGSALPLVTLGLIDPDPALAETARKTFRAIGFRENCVPVLRSLVDEASDSALISLLGFLAQSGERAQPASPLVLEVLGRPDAKVRQAAEEAFYAIGFKPTKAALGAVAQLLEHRDWNIRLRALALLSGCGSEARAAQPHVVKRMIDSNFEVRQKARETFACLGFTPACLPELEEILENHVADNRLQILGILKEFGDIAKPALPVVLRRMADSNYDVRKMAESAAERIGYDVAALAEFARLLGHPNWEIRFRTLKLLTVLHEEAGDAAEFILSCLDDRSSRVAEAAAEAFVAIGFNAECLPQFERLLDHRNYRIRVSALQLLQRIGQDAAAARPLVEKLTKDKQAAVRNAAARALQSVAPA